jgi:hypothetical protein
MDAIIYLLGTFIADLLKSRRRLEVENLFLRHQLNIILRRPPQRLRLRGSDRPFCERLPASLGDLHTRDFNRASADNHALAVCGGESGAHKLNYLFDSEAMGEQDRLGAAVPTSREQLERAAAVGLGAASDAGHAP